MQLLVRKVTDLTPTIKAFELVDPTGAPLPEFEPGAHIEIATGNGDWRAYSLANDRRERDRYLIAVLLDTSHTGGSQWMHDFVCEGETLEVSAPENGFPLAEDAAESVLIAGGIGVTPIVSMAQHLRAQGKRYWLHYISRKPESSAFLEEIRAQGGVTHHTATAGRPALGALIGTHAPGRHVYVCGPQAMIDAVRVACADWPVDAVHFEIFANRQPANFVGGEPFEVKLSRSGRVLTVPSDKTLLQVLREAGVRVPAACTSGICGTCKVGIVAGEVDHRDKVLSEAERRTRLQTCVSRGKAGSLLELDR